MVDPKLLKVIFQKYTLPDELTPSSPLTVDAATDGNDTLVSIYDAQHPAILDNFTGEVSFNNFDIALGDEIIQYETDIVPDGLEESIIDHLDIWDIVRYDYVQPFALFMDDGELVLFVILIKGIYLDIPEPETEGGYESWMM